MEVSTFSTSGYAAPHGWNSLPGQEASLNHENYETTLLWRVSAVVTLSSYCRFEHEHRLTQGSKLAKLLIHWQEALFYMPDRAQ